MEPEVGYDPTRTSYLLATTRGIGPSTSPEDSGKTWCQRLNSNQLLRLYEGLDYPLRLRWRKWQGIGESNSSLLVLETGIIPDHPLWCPVVESNHCLKVRSFLSYTLYEPGVTKMVGEQRLKLCPRVPKTRMHSIHHSPFKTMVRDQRIERCSSVLQTDAKSPD